MKKLFTILAFIALSTCVWAQSPQTMSYQTVMVCLAPEFEANRDG